MNSALRQDEITQQAASPATRISRLSDAQLLAGLLYEDVNAEEAVNSATALLRRYGSLLGVRHVSSMHRGERPGLSDLEAMRIRISHELVRRQLEQALERGTSLTSPSMTADYLQTALRNRRREIFACLFLDTRHRVIAFEELFQGSIDGACVYPRVVAERALRLGAAALIVAHNHPSGISEPSLADQAITRRLKEALALLEIRLLDHFIVGDGAPVSMASRGML